MIVKIAAPVIGARFDRIVPCSRFSIGMLRSSPTDIEGQVAPDPGKQGRAGEDADMVQHVGCQTEEAAECGPRCCPPRAQAFDGDGDPAGCGCASSAPDGAGASGGCVI